MKFDHELLESVAGYLMEKCEESNSEKHPSESPSQWLIRFFRYTLNGDIQLFANFVRQHYEGDYILNELRKDIVEPWAYYNRRALLIDVSFFVMKLNPESTSF